MRLRPITLIIIISWVLWGHNASSAQFNLSPVLFYESSDEEYTLDMIGPIFSFSSDKSALRPLFYRDDQQTDILFPLGHSTRDRGLFFPIYSAKKEEYHPHTTVFPFFYGRYEQQRYGGLFPLYGSLYHRFGYDKARFVLWPIYSATTIDKATTYYILWPVFSYCKDREFKIFPLYGWEKSMDSRHDFVLWPIFHRKRGLHTVDAALPLFLYSRGDSYKNISVIWPLFACSKDERSGHTSMDAFWPLVRFARGGYDETRIFPLYRKKIIPPAYEVTTVLWPVYRKERIFDKNGDLRREKTNILILSKHAYEVSRQGEETRETTCWPVWHSSISTHERSWYFPWILPLKNNGYKRNWLPVLTLAHAEKSAGSSFVDILWHTFYYNRDGSSCRCSFSFLCSYEKGPDYTRVGFLFDLLKIPLGRDSFGDAVLP